MKKYICGLMVLASGWAFSQSILNATSPEEFRRMREERREKSADSTVSNRVTPLQYGFVDQKDILKSVMVWEIIDLNDKVNQPFYYNTDRLTVNNKSLYQVLLDGALDGTIKEVYDEDDFKSKLTPDQIKKRLTYETLDPIAIDIMNDENRNLTPDEIKQYTNVYQATSEKIKMLKIMGMWYIDKRDGQMKYRPLGIAALGPDPASMSVIDPTTGKPFASDLIDLFWIYYPDAREVLANSIVYNPKNASSDLSYDDLINARRFGSVIYKSDAGLGNGEIKKYIPKNADEQIEESDRIKGEILEMENDMWNY